MYFNCKKAEIRNFSCISRRNNLLLHISTHCANKIEESSMSISKTRQTLVDVARQLFAKNGVANTTMNDIAQASGKGRRTLYTYFNRKEDVYNAVIESELERLSDKLDEVAAKKIRPQDKIIELIYTHLSMIRETVVRNGNLRAEFFRNIWTVEKVRQTWSWADRGIEQATGCQSGLWCFGQERSDKISIYIIRYINRRY